LAESDFELLERSKIKFHVVHSPRSHDYFGQSRFPFDRLRSVGFNICLGTDSLASNESLSLFDEMRAFQKEFPGVFPEEILQTGHGKSGALVAAGKCAGTSALSRACQRSGGSLVVAMCSNGLSRLPASHG
jgi:hypothetical protein